MSVGLYKSTVPIVRVTSDAPVELLGTGIVVATNIVITCLHVIENMYEAGATDAECGVLCGPEFCRTSDYSLSDVWDLACLRVERLPGKTPASLARSARLTNLKLAASGFLQRTGIIEHSIPELNVIEEEISGGWLQAAQFGCGLPGGFSGAPAFAEERVLGMLCLGGEISATSRMIAIDPIAQFLAKLNVDPDMLDLAVVVTPNAQTTSKISISAGRDFKRNIARARAEEIELLVGRDLMDSNLELNDESPPGDQL